MGTGSSVAKEKDRTANTRVRTENNNTLKAPQGNGYHHSLQVEALLSTEYTNKDYSKPAVNRRRVQSFQIGSTTSDVPIRRKVKYRAPQPPISVTPFRASVENSVSVEKDVAVASHGEVKVSASPLLKRDAARASPNIPRITIQKPEVAVTMADTCVQGAAEVSVRETEVTLGNSVKPIPSPRISKSSSMIHKSSPSVSPELGDKMVHRHRSDVNRKSPRTLTPPTYAEHVKRHSDCGFDNDKVKSGAKKPVVHKRHFSDVPKPQVSPRPSHSTNVVDIDSAYTSDGSVASLNKADTQSVISEKREKPKPAPRSQVTRPESLTSGLKLDLKVARSEMAWAETGEASPRGTRKATKVKPLTKVPSEENSEGYHSGVSSHVDDDGDDHDDDADIVTTLDKRNKPKLVRRAPINSMLSPTTPPGRPRFPPPYARAVSGRTSTLSSNDSLDSVDEVGLSSSYGSGSTRDDRSDLLGDSLPSPDFMSSNDSLTLQEDAVELRKPKARIHDRLRDKRQRLVKSNSADCDNPRLAASCEALHDITLGRSLPEEDWQKFQIQIQKSKSMLDVPDRAESPVSPNGSPKSSHSGSPRVERKSRLGLDRMKFFTKFPGFQATSPSTKRRTVPILEDKVLAPSEGRKSTPIELFENSPLNPNRRRPPDYETTVQNLIHGSSKVTDQDRLQQIKRYSLQPGYRHEAWLAGPHVTVKRTSIVKALDLDSPNGNLASLNLEGLNQTFPTMKRGKKSQTMDDLISPRFRKARGLKISLTARKESRQTEQSYKVKDTLLLFPSDGFSSSGVNICYVIDVDGPLVEIAAETDFEVQRIPEYDKYLQDLRTETAQTHPDFEELTKTAQRVSKMVKEREEEMNNAENEYKVDYVQDRFPNDDLQLNEKEKSNQRIRALQSRRRSAPSAVLIKSIGVRNRGTTNLNSRPLPFVSDDLPNRHHNSSRAYLLEGPVQLSAGIQPQDRYLFLFNDILLIAKKKSATTFKLKHRIRVCELWISTSNVEDVTEASTATCPPEKSFTIGWPTANMVATFNTPDLKDLWLNKLTNQITEEKNKEEPKIVSLKILNKEMPGYASSKVITVMNTEEATDVIKACLEQFEIADAKPEDYQIWVRSGKEGTMSAYPLFGHEHPYSIKMSHVRDAAKATGNVILAQDTEIGSETVPLECQCQFIIKHKSKSQLLNIANKKSKKSPIASLFRRNNSRREVHDDFGDGLDGQTQGKLFGQRLADICEDDTIPKPVMDMLTRLFHEGPGITGILRKSANKKACENLKSLFDADEEYVIDDWSILVIGDTLKLFFREMPDSVFGGDMYERFVSSCDIQDTTERVEEVKHMIENLPKCNQNILRHFFCVLCHIDKNCKENNMNAYNLAVCVGPSILRNPQAFDGKDPLFSDTCKKETLCVQFVIENFVELFGEDAWKLYGEPKLTMRQDSGTDSDSMHSILSMQESTGGLRRDDSSLDSLDRELYSSEIDSSPQLAKSHLSPTNLSRDSGLTLSDTQLYEEGADSEHSNNSGGRSGQPEIVFSREDLLMPVPPPRSKRRRGSEPQTQLDQARMLARMCAVPGNGALASGMGQEKNRGSLCHTMSSDVFKSVKHHPGQLQTKKLSMESLRSVEENSESEFQTDFERFQSQGDIGVLRKSSSGARLFFDEELVMTHRPGEAIPPVAHGLTVDRRPSNSSQDSEPSTPSSPHMYRRVWHSDSPKQTNLSASYGSYQNSLNPNYVPVMSHSDSSKLSAPSVSHAQAMSRSAPTTPDCSSPSNSPRGSFSKYLSKDSDRSPQASSVDLFDYGSNESETESLPVRKVTTAALTLTNPTLRNAKYSDTVGCGSPPPDVILRNQLYKGQPREQMFDYNSKLLKVDNAQKSAHDRGSSCSSDDDDRPTQSVTSSLSSLNSSGSQERTDRTTAAGHSAARKKGVLKSQLLVEKSSSDTNVLKQFNKGSHTLGRQEHLQKRPERPPSYQEAITRKILLKSGSGTQAVVYTDKDVVEQSANSANARKLYEESLKKYNQEKDSPPSSQKASREDKSDKGRDSRYSRHHQVGSAIQEEPVTPPRSPATVRRSQSDGERRKDLKQHFKSSLFYVPGTNAQTSTTRDSNTSEKAKPELLRQKSGNRDPGARYSDCSLAKEDKNSSTVQYYKTIMNASEQTGGRRQPPPYRHPPPVGSQASAASNKPTSSPEETGRKSDRKPTPKLRKQGSGTRLPVELSDNLMCTEESLV